MATKREFNLPDKDDPDFADKVVGLIRQLFEGSEKNIQNFTPISNPEEGTQIGSMWYDRDSDKITVVTPSGIRTLKFD